MRTGAGRWGRFPNNQPQNHMSKEHPGFKAVAAKVSRKEGIPMKNAAAIIAASSRNASAKAKAANPRLNRVKG